MNERLNRFSKKALSLVVLFLAGIFAVCAQVNVPSFYPDRIILNPAQETETSVAVTWRTNIEVSEGFCELQPLVENRIDVNAGKRFKAETITANYDHEGEAPVSSNHHSFVLHDLKPSTAYMYRVGVEGYWSEWLEFTTPDGSDTEFSFIYFGDPQSDIKSQWSRIVRKAYWYNPNCDFMLYAGDLINSAGSDEQWDEWFKAGGFIYGMVPQLATPGNHDYDEYTLDPHWNAQFSHPMNGPKGLEGTCYFVDHKNLRLISFDSAAEGELENESGYALLRQKAWLDSVLTSNTKEWVIVTSHLPFYSPKESRDNKIIRKHFQPILEKHGVDLVLSGHDHSYARGIASDDPGCKNPVMYVVSVSGPKQYEAGDKDWMQHKGSNMQLFQNIEINNKVLTLETYTATGRLYDKFVLKKKRNGENKVKDKKPITY